MSTLCTYIIRIDAGLAPNPFWNWCTLAVCTPNHQGVKLAPGDWIAGFTAKGKGNKLIYAMMVSELLDFDHYFHDPRFQQKKPQVNGSPMQRCGDNFYSRGAEGAWVQHPNSFHAGMTAQDTKYPTVFIASRFWYWGKSAVEVSVQFLPLIPQQHGCKKDHAPALVSAFQTWVSTFPEGKADHPSIWEDAQETECAQGCANAC